MNAVQIDNVTHSYGATIALQNLSWTAPSGAVTAILGPNGAGKTTVIEMCEGLRCPDEGSVRILGQNPWNATADHRARVGVMLQDGGLPAHTRPMRMLEHFAGFYAHPRDPERIAQALGLADFAMTPARRLSGGQRQRLALSCALVGKAEVLFLDEPTAGLDPQSRNTVWQIIRQEAQRGAAVVVTTHNFAEAEYLADRLIIMADGKTKAMGSAAEVGGTRGLEKTYFALTGGDNLAVSATVGTPAPVILDDVSELHKSDAAAQQTAVQSLDTEIDGAKEK